ncbi:LOW QUALITY PROTEIN: hypothetical protein V1477_006336 [Vespula maculifrons]|uniref:Uncharacterized protein n=1 Tax=Vespula maculifrons TaxID=7453 RepID=A0ABD2CK52_VESMC
MVVEGATSPLNDPGPVLLGAIISEKKNFPLNRYNSAPIGPICTQKIWATRRALSNDPGPVHLGTIVSEKQIVKEKFFFPLFPLNRYNSAPIGPICMQKIWAGRDVPFKRPRSGSARYYSSGEKNCTRNIFFPLFPINRYNSAPIGPICMQKIWA